MKSKSNLFKTFITGLLLSGLFVFNACEKEKIFPFSYDNTTEELYSIMDKYYYWVDSIGGFEPGNYASPDELLEAMRYNPRDRWSYITTKEENEQYYEEGTFVGYGFGYAPDENGKIRITYLYADSDMAGLGITRGWIINKINGNAIDDNSNISSLLGATQIGVSNTFEFESPSGEVITQTLSKKLVSINTVIYKDVFVSGSKKAGYMVFESFIGPSEEELNIAFNYFKSQNVNELVIDLRYNGGGMIDIVEHLAGYIIPDDLDNKKFLTYKHNEKNSNINESIYFNQHPNSLRLNKVYFIAGKGSASASEAIINGLDPYIDVYIVGDDTYGKPVGMYSFNSRISDLVYVPICFSLVNANDYGNYFNGLTADSYVTDDVYHNFGIEEAVFAEAMYHITYGSFSSAKSAGTIYRAPVKEIRSIADERGSI